MALVAIAAACSEELESGAACPALCPVESVPVRDTLITSIPLDSTLANFPLSGEQPFALLATAPGTPALDVRLVARFDTVQRKYLPTGAVDSAAITAVDSGYLRLILDSASIVATAPVTFEAYDVDSAGVDTTVAGLAPLFRPSRRLGGVTVAAADVKDSVRVPIDNAALVAKIVGGARVRIGVRILSAAPARLRVATVDGASPAASPRLSFDPSTDATYSPIFAFSSSDSPAGDAAQAFALRNFTLGVSVPRSALATDLVVGGVGGRRTYLRFDVPQGLLDSANVVRATLILTQRDNATQVALDSVRVVPDVVIANRNVADLRRAATLTASISPTLIDTLRAAPTTSGTRELSIAPVITYWRLQSDSAYQAISLRALYEGAQATELRFYSTEAPADVRPRLRISYIPRTQFGLP